MTPRAVASAGLSLVFLVLGPTLAPADEPPSPPAVEESPPAGVEGSTVVLRGAVDPFGSTTIWYFQIGRSTRYGIPLTRTSFEEPLYGSGNLPVEEAIDCLAPRTTYHFRLIARNKAGKSVGEDQTFTTEGLSGGRRGAYAECRGHRPVDRSNPGGGFLAGQDSRLSRRWAIS